MVAILVFMTMSNNIKLFEIVTTLSGSTMCDYFQNGSFAMPLNTLEIFLDNINAVLFVAKNRKVIPIQE